VIYIRDSLEVVYWLCVQVRDYAPTFIYVSRANFLTTLRSHLDVTCSCYFWSSLFNVDDESLHTLDNQPTSSTIT
jgi:hypothetical protein